jgi:hypothetical protein
MWLKLGETEIINLEYISTIKRNPKEPIIEIVYHDLNHIKSLPFSNVEDRDRAYKAIIENLSRLKLFLE